MIIGPNHTGYGAAVSVWAKGVWKTPFGEIEIDEELAANILDGIIQADETAHLYEHSIEVQIPWLQHLYKEQIKIVPITMMAQDMVIAKKVGHAISQTGNDIVIIASSDFSHYEPQATATEKDRTMIEAIIDLNEEELYQQRKFLNSTMCGFGPVASAIVAAKEMQAKEATLLKYATSGDVTGDYSSVVGYASIVIKR